MTDPLAIMRDIDNEAFFKNLEWYKEAKVRGNATFDNFIKWHETPNKHNDVNVKNSSNILCNRDSSTCKPSCKKSAEALGIPYKDMDLAFLVNE